MVKVKRLKCLESNCLNVNFYFLIFSSLFDYGGSTRAGNIKILLGLGDFGNFSGHYSQFHDQGSGYLQVHPLRHSDTHNLLARLVWYKTIFFTLKKDLTKSDICLFEHKKKIIIRIGCLFENHPT